MKFEDHALRPMLIGIEKPSFDDEDYIYELKLDGVRCLMYLDEHTFIQNKRGLSLNKKFPELKEIHKQVKHRCILDGELYVFKDGKPDFFEVQRRTLTSDPFKIKLHAKQSPACFTAFDILMEKDELLLQEPLMKRKKRLDQILKETDLINISRYIETQGTALFQLAKEKQLEGIVAKRKNSLYYPEKRTKDWIKSKHLLDDDYVITGYILKEKGMVSLILAQYHDAQLLYKGHVTMGVSLSYLQQHTAPSGSHPFFDLPDGNEDAIWIRPHLVGTVSFMEYTRQGGLRQPVFKGFREDKTPEECIGKSTNRMD